MTAHDPMLGRVFGGRWRVDATLTSGGMGSVYIAVHGDTGRRVALKVIRGDVATEPDFVARFRRETSALAALSHPNVVTFLDSGVDEGDAFLVMELLAGRSLREAMVGAMPPARATRIAADVCRALAAVHRAGLVHRDLKPENVFLQDAAGHDDVVKLIDFGIVKNGAPQSTSTKTGAIVGTPGYISPEQLRGQPATATSDVYAVGVMLYEMVAGRSPFVAPDIQAMLVRQLIDPVTPPSTLVPTLPPALEVTIMRLMERDAAARVPDALEALRLLTPEALLAGQVDGMQGGVGRAAPAGDVAERPTPHVGALEIKASSQRSQRLVPAIIVTAALVGVPAAFAVWPRHENLAASAPASTAALALMPAPTSPTLSVAPPPPVPHVEPRSDGAPPEAAPAAVDAGVAPILLGATASSSVPPAAGTTAVPTSRKSHKASTGAVASTSSAAPPPVEPALHEREPAAVVPPAPRADIKGTLAEQLSRKLAAAHAPPAASPADDGTLLTMRGALVRQSGAADVGQFTVTRRRIFFSGKEPETFEVDDLVAVQRANGIDGERVRLVFRALSDGRVHAVSTRTLVVTDVDRFIHQVQRLIDGK